MRIVHLADLHLGYRAFQRTDARGVNQREADVAAAFRQAVERTVALRPELVLIAGDVFHTTRPSNASITEAFRQLSSLTARLPGVPVVVIAGVHDSPRASDASHVLALYREVGGVRVVTDRAERVELPELNASVTCVPHDALVAPKRAGVRPAGDPPLEPHAGSRFNVLLLHGRVAGATATERQRAAPVLGGATVDAERIVTAAWDYVALGHLHSAVELAPNMWYAGAIERTSMDLWSEADDARGFLCFDVAARRAEFQRLDTRPVVDLPRLTAREMAVAEIDAALRAAVDAIEGGIDGKLVRQVVHDIPRRAVRELDHRRIREWKARAAHFHLDLRPPREAGIQAAGLQRQTLAEQLGSFLSERWTPTREGVRTERLVELAARYMAGAGEEAEP